MVNPIWRTEPTPVETVGDDLWIAEKFQSNRDIAGSPRNIFRDAVLRTYTGGRALNRLGVSDYY